MTDGSYWIVVVYDDSDDDNDDDDDDKVFLWNGWPTRGVNFISSLDNCWISLLLDFRFGILVFHLEAHAREIQLKISLVNI